MTYYPDWFDYAKWLFVGFGALGGFLTLSEPAGRKRGLLKLGFCTLLASGIVIGALGGVLFNLRAPHLTAEGTLFDVFVRHGKRSYTTFRLRSTTTSEIDGLSMSSAHDDLLNGEVARVTYQDGSLLALRVLVLEGPNAGKDHTEIDGLIPSWIALVFGIGLAAYGVLNWLKDGTGIPFRRRRQPAAPDGDVDSQSMLHLESK